MTAATAELQQAILDAIAEQTRLLTEWSVTDLARSWYVTSSATSVLIFQENTNRCGAVIVNTDANDMWIRYGKVAATTASGGWTYKIPAGATWEMPLPVFTGPVQGVWTAAGAGVAETTEF